LEVGFSFGSLAFFKLVASHPQINPAVFNLVAVPFKVKPGSRVFVSRMVLAIAASATYVIVPQAAGIAAFRRGGRSDPLS
jgi:hypothetical protein